MVICATAIVASEQNAATHIRSAMNHVKFKEHLLLLLLNNSPPVLSYELCGHCTTPELKWTTLRSQWRLGQLYKSPRLWLVRF